MKNTSIIVFIFHCVFLYADTTIVAFNSVHHFFGGGTNNRTVIDSIQLPGQNNDYQQIL